MIDHLMLCGISCRLRFTADRTSDNCSCSIVRHDAITSNTVAEWRANCKGGRLWQVRHPSATARVTQPRWAPILLGVALHLQLHVRLQSNTPCDQSTRRLICRLHENRKQGKLNCSETTHRVERQSVHLQSCREVDCSLLVGVLSAATPSALRKDRQCSVLLLVSLTETASECSEQQGNRTPTLLQAVLTELHSLDAP